MVWWAHPPPFQVKRRQSWGTRSPELSPPKDYQTPALKFYLIITGNNDSVDPLQSLRPQRERTQLFLISTCTINKANALSEAVLKPLLWVTGSERDALILSEYIRGRWGHSPNHKRGHWRGRGEGGVVLHQGVLISIRLELGKSGTLAESSHVLPWSLWLAGPDPQCPYPVGHSQPLSHLCTHHTHILNINKRHPSPHFLFLLPLAQLFALP